MKLFKIILSTFCFCTLANAQSSSISHSTSISSEFTIPVFPGCEKEVGRQAMMECFQKGLTSTYTRHLEKYLDAFEYLNIPNAESEISFTIRPNGDLSLKQINSTSGLYKDYNILAFEAMTNEMQQKNQHIISAQSLDKINMNVNLSFPVGFKLTQPVEEIDNRVICILNDEDKTYEVIITPTKDIKIYEIGGVKPFYLGKFNSLEEIKNTLPYKNLIQDENHLVTLAQSDFKDVKLILQSKNIFHANSFYTLFIVSQVKGKRIKQLRKYDTFAAFKQSPYYDWIVRNK